MEAHRESEQRGFSVSTRPASLQLTLGEPLGRFHMWASSPAIHVCRLVTMALSSPEVFTQGCFLFYTLLPA